jgi:hypothetical protein
MSPDLTDAVMADAIEHGLWQNLADSLNRLEEWGLMPLHPARTVDTPVIHGSSPRTGGYRLAYQVGFTPDPDRPGHDLPSGWQVTTHTVLPATTGVGRGYLRRFATVTVYVYLSTSRPGTGVSSPALNRLLRDGLVELGTYEPGNGRPVKVTDLGRAVITAYPEH